MMYVMLEWTFLKKLSRHFFFLFGWACKDDIGRGGSGPRLSGPMRGLGFDQEMGEKWTKSG